MPIREDDYIILESISLPVYTSATLCTLFPVDLASFPSQGHLCPIPET